MKTNDLFLLLTIMYLSIYWWKKLELKSRQIDRPSEKTREIQKINFGSLNNLDKSINKDQLGKDPTPKSMIYWQ